VTLFDQVSAENETTFYIATLLMSFLVIVENRCLSVFVGLSVLIVVAIALLIGACVLCGGLIILKR